MVNLLSEQLLSLSDAAKLVPVRRGGRKAHVSCIYRWTTTGCKGIVLESIQCGGTRCTSKEALARFFCSLSGNLPQANTETAASRERARDSRFAAAEKELDQARI